MICFSGAHYKVICRNREQYSGRGTQYFWKLYNDERKDYLESWFDVVQNCIDTQSVPTFVFFERTDADMETEMNHYTYDRKKAYLHTKDLID
jgi:hypothetical protein